MGNNLYSNQESAWAAQISYCFITQEIVEATNTYYGTDVPTFSQICNYSKLSGVSLVSENADESVLNFINDSNNNYYGMWKVVGVYDDNANTGLYAVALETGEYTANDVEDGVILAVRGSEANDNQFLLDWILTDMNIVNSDLTSQEQKLNQFIDEEFAPLVLEKGYQNVAGIGHSLGGYLCFEGLAHIAATNPVLYDLLMQGVSIDGPNPPDENYQANESAYLMIKDFCYHYQYSLVGNIFEDNCICDEDHRFSIKEASNWQYNPTEFGVSFGASYELMGPQAQFFIQYLFGCVLRHNLPSLCFTEDGDFDYTANDTYNCPPDLFSDDNVSWYRISGLQTIFFCINSILFSLENQTNEGTVAEIVGKLTQYADESNYAQIVFGSLVETITEEYNLFVMSNVSDDLKIAIEDVSLDSRLLTEVMFDYFSFALPIVSNSGDVVISSDIIIDKWFDFLSDIDEFGQSFVQHTNSDYNNIANDVLSMDCVMTMNVVECAAELSKELLSSSEQAIQSIILLGTQAIVSNVTDWNSYSDYINAQKELTSNWANQINSISNNITTIGSAGNDLINSLNEYKIASLKFMTASVTSYANASIASGLTSSTVSNLSILRQDMTNATNHLLSKAKTLSIGGDQLFRNIATLVKQGIEDSFKYVYAWGELEVSNVVVEAATELYKYISESNISGLVDNWMLVANSHNGATDVIYGVADGIMLEGTKKADIIVGNGSDDRIYGYDGDDTIYGGAGHDYVEAGNGDDTVYGGSGYDVLQGNSGSDILYGESGNDKIYGGQGSDYLNGGDGDDYLLGEGSGDTLEGGQGNDYLEGGEGRDSYVFNLGDGADTVCDYEYYRGAADDSIVFGSGITPDMVRMERIGNDLVVQYSSSDSFVVKDAYQIWHTGGEYFVEKMVFSDGTVWNTETIADKANIHYSGNDSDTIEGLNGTVGYHQSETFHGMGGNDRIYAKDGNDVVFGDEGNDTLYGEDGNDILVGGTGSDHLDGASGADSYVFNLGDGVDEVYDYEYYRGKANDRIIFGQGITPDMVRLERFGNDMKVWYSKNDNFIVKDAYQIWHTQGEFFVENIEFSNGTVWNTEDIANLANIHLGGSGDDALVGYGETVGYHQNETFYAGAGNDVVYASSGNDRIFGESDNDSLYGEDGNDTLIGGRNNDYLDGGNGQDTFVFNVGDGIDTVYDYEYYRGKANDRILFGAGITPDMVRLERFGNDMKVWYSPSDNFIVKDAYQIWHTQGEYFVENIEFADGTIWNTENIANLANIHLGGSGDDYLVGYGETVGYHQSETFYAGAGNDVVNASSGNDIIYGEADNDSLYGEDGNDTLIGGRNNDYLDGGNGQDTFVFNLGDGVDTVYDYEYYRGKANDRILFGEGITPDMVRLERFGNDMKVWYSASDNFVVKDAYQIWHTQGEYFVENIEFADGTVWNTEEIANRANVHLGGSGDDYLVGYGETVGYHQDESFYAGAGNDVVYAFGGNDRIFGESDNDSLYGEDGNDTLIGGRNNDYLDGGNGQDTFVFNLGDGVDTVYDYEYYRGKANDRILFGTGITPDTVRLERFGNDMKVWYSPSDNFIVKDAYQIWHTQGEYFVENIEFADGTIWNTEDIANRANKHLGGSGDDYLVGYGETVGYHQNETFYAGAGNDIVNAGDGADKIYGEGDNDSLYGENGDDTLIGGRNNDYLDGGNGQDTFVFNLGDGVDTVYDYEYYRGKANDRILFGAGITPDMVRLERFGNDMKAWYSESDNFIVKDAYQIWHTQGEYFVENVEFADGTIWNTEDIANRANKHLGGAGDDYLVGYGETFGYHQSETFYAGAGNDVVHAGEGADRIFGESDNDSLYGENGDDTLIGGRNNDYLDGGSGQDTFVFNLGDGVDIVYDYEYYRGKANDKILFGEGIAVSDVRIERFGNDMKVWYSANDNFIVKDAYQVWHTQGEYFVENIEFADGTVWNTEDIANRANIHLGGSVDDSLVGYGETVGYHQSETFYAGDGNDVVHASDGNDRIYGEADNDKLYGENGNDTLIGGTGNDYVDGGAGQDTFVFYLGDGIDTVYDYEYYRGNGNDRILFGEGIAVSDVRIERFGNDMKVWYSANDNFIVKDAYQVWHTQGEYFVENIEFADGTVWNTEEIANRANIHLGGSGDDSLVGYGETVGYHQNETFYAGDGNDVVHASDGNDIIYGEDGNDKLYGENGDDTLVGGIGDDYIEGGSGEDKYLFNLGDGNDVILDYEYYRGKSNDCIVFGEGIDIGSILLARTGNNLHISYSDNDSVTIKDAYSRWHTEGEYYVEHMEFSDGTKADINYNTVSLDVTYQPEPEVIEEVIEQIPSDEEVEEMFSIITNSEISLEDFDIDAITEEVEKVLSNTIIEENVSTMPESEMSMGEIADMEMEKITNLIIQESATQVESNVADSLTICENNDISNDQLWVE